MANVIFKFGTKAEYDALATKDAHTLYWLYDVLELRKGTDLYGKGANATNLASGLMSAADKQKLDSLSADGIGSLAPVDHSVVIADTDGGKTIGVRISEESGNALLVKEDGLFVSGNAVSGGVEFALEKQETAAEGYSATYKLKRTEGENVTYVGDEINIPKDMVLQGGTMEVATEADQPYAGAAIGDPYLDLVLNDAAATHIYIPVKGLVDAVSAGDGIKVEDNVIFVKVNPASANGLSVDTDGLSMGTATTTAAGAMSAVDKAALDNVVNEVEEIKGSIVWGSLGE